MSTGAETNTSQPPLIPAAAQGMVTIIIKDSGKQIELPAAMTTTDDRLREAMIGLWKGAANADIERKEVGGVAVIEMRSKPGDKGAAE
jgi:hypothetical protein